MASGGGGGDVKKEPIENSDAGEEAIRNGAAVQKRLFSSSSSQAVVIDIDSSSSSSSSDSDSDSDDAVSVENGDGGDGGFVLKKRRKMNEVGVVLPVGFLNPITPLMLPESNVAAVDRPESSSKVVSSSQGCKQFWKAGDYEGASGGDWVSSSGNFFLIFYSFINSIVRDNLFIYFL